MVVILLSNVVLNFIEHCATFNRKASARIEKENGDIPASLK
jgi:hypothetical protein